VAHIIAAGAQTPPMRLLEREHALEVLGDCPPGSVGLVTGEAGVGKTSLVRAFCERSGRRVLWGACDALRTPRPLGPLRDMARHAGGDLASVMAADGPRHMQFSAFLDELDKGPVIAVVEDAHWADEATLDLLIYAGRRASTTQGLLVVTYRDHEAGRAHRLGEVLGALATNRGSVRRVHLSPLSLQAVAALAGPSGLDPAVLHARTGGNPFFVTEVLADPVRPVPDNVRDAVLARAGRLTAAERDVLDAVAVFPGHAVLALVRGSAESVDACVRAGMLVRDGGRLWFRHELTRIAIEETIPPARKAALHAQALADLTARHADPAQLAYHAAEAGDDPAVLVHAQRAAQKAAAVGAHRQAAEHYTQALGVGATPIRERAQLLESYSETCAALDRYALAITASQEAIECWRETGEHDRVAALLARRSHYLWNTGDSDAAQASVRAALTLTERWPSDLGLAAAYTWSAVLFMLASDDDAALRTGIKAIELAENSRQPALAARAHSAVGGAMWCSDPASAERHLLRSLRIAQGLGDAAAAGNALVNLGSGASEVRRYPQAEGWLRDAISWCATHDLDATRRYATAWLARCVFDRGDWSQAATILYQAEETERTPSRIETLTVLGRLRARRGEAGAAEALDEAWDLAARSGHLLRMWPVAAGRAELAWLRGRPTADLVGDTYALALRVGHPWAIGELGQWVAESRSQTHVRAAEPYRLDPAASATAWDALGCPYEAAIALAASDIAGDLQESLRRLEGLGAVPAADIVAKRLRQIGVRTSRRSTLRHPHGLTRREAEVLDLLREGLRNTQIAERLYIAPKTVDHHVAAILAKLGVHSRHAAAERYGS
jgi:DNA-binding CsgD family transcriptional regulator/tetratricopeptide (TPR) repeat protein